MENLRIRIEFENLEILSKQQRSQGLKRSWILLNPRLHKSISDLSSYILHTFNLQQSCPNGILLSMEGFALPSFESTCILKDKDIICIKKKGGNSDIEGAKSDDEIDIIEEYQRPINSGLLLLANEEFEKETGGYKSEEEEDDEETPVEKSDTKAVSKKRKASKKLKSSKKKKRRSEDTDAIENDAKSRADVESTPEIADRSNKNVDSTSSGKRKKNGRLGDTRAVKNGEVKRKAHLGSPTKVAKRTNKDVEPTSNGKRNDELEQNGQQMKEVSHVPSRNARRKKAKRQWLREITKAEKEAAGSNLKEHQEKTEAEKKEPVSHAKGLLHWKQSPEKSVNKQQCAQPNQNSDKGDDLIPVVVRPGHIRFEPLEEDEAVQQSQLSVENYGWNGITSKRKGQKWGQENFSSLRLNAHKNSNKEYSETLTVEEDDDEEEATVKGSVDFDKLPPLPSFPKDGDILAYRLLELSSTWTPELSSFRVGRVSSYNPESSIILLTPVPEYPISFEKLEEDLSEVQSDNSLYKEDGSLEIEFSSLVDIRIVKHGTSLSANNTVDGSFNEGPLGSKDALSNSATTNNNEETETQIPPENGEVKKCVWDEVGEALNAKKAQLSEENNGSNKKGRSPWSYRALRGGALGPTMAILRSKNGILE